MAAIQTPDEISTLVARLEGEKCASLEVLGINSLKSLSPMPGALTGETIECTKVDDRRFTVTTDSHQVEFDLQRTGKVLWLSSAQPYAVTGGASRPTVRLILANGQGLDLTEPGRTKRIAVTIRVRG
ncbi:hypothetical protein [Pedococcus bigeumensis]|uniref:Uncharacterized protein n=1 Tax=Pedococcus bigeumensis TaxID=433644 RepID=A0A502CVA3_9MICO|nr:hypothetical protein [Pedococcus bigeumensis]TPG17177.1 hypothetical protein EAH86_10465 [Pedococcus bigeumensis]